MQHDMNLVNFESKEYEPKRQTRDTQLGYWSNCSKFTVRFWQTDLQKDEGYARILE